MEPTAYHEAGHAYLAVVHGGRVSLLTLEPDRDDGPARFGEARIEWQHPLTAKEQHHKWVLVALAGPVAEMIYNGEPLHPGFVAEWADDWQQAWAAAEFILPDERLRLAFLEEAVRQVHTLLRQDAAWACIAALADELLAHETLEWDQMQEVFQQWLRR